MRSRDSRYYGKRFMMRLDPQAWEKLEGLSMRVDESIAEIIRQLVAQAKIEDFLQTWPRASGGAHTTIPPGWNAHTVIAI